jgi:hypothetical protein
MMPHGQLDLSGIAVHDHGANYREQVATTVVRLSQPRGHRQLKISSGKKMA